LPSEDKEATPISLCLKIALPPRFTTQDAVRPALIYPAPMRHPIDPKIDCVFKALLGAESNQRLLVHFLNAMLGAELPAPVVEVTILNPYNEREFLDDKLSVVDVKARDEHGRLYQIEIQLLVLPELPARILYGWADLYSAQLRSGEDYTELRPTYAIWLLGETLLPQVPGYAHRYRLRDEQGRGLIDHGGIWLFELSKFAVAQVETEEERWLKFFNEGEQLQESDLPEWMQTDEMRQAMGTLKEFSEKDRAYHTYQARRNYLRQQRSIERHIEALMAEAEQARAEKEQAKAAEERARAAEERAKAAEEYERLEKEHERAEKEAALAEIERLKQLLEGNPPT
jgi:predicted transposase/invertase (TIGR01784 family)